MSEEKRDTDADWFCKKQRELCNHSRGQLILTGVVTLGILLIAMTLVLNGFLYTENVESGGVPEEVSEIESIQRMVHTEYGELLIQTNTQSSDPRSDYSVAANNARTAIRMQEAAAQGRRLTISSQSQTDGRLFSGKFSSIGNTQWSISASDARRFQIAVEPSSLTDIEDAFHVVVEDDSGTEWTAYIARNESNTFLEVEAGDSRDRYVIGGVDQPLTIDLVTGSVKTSNSDTVDKIDLYADGYASNLNEESEIYNISFKNTTEAEGRYTITVPDNGSFDSGKAVVYDSRFEVTYESANHYYSGDIRIEPCNRSATTCLTYIQATGGA